MRRNVIWSMLAALAVLAGQAVTDAKEKKGGGSSNQGSVRIADKGKAPKQPSGVTSKPLVNSKPADTKVGTPKVHKKLTEQGQVVQGKPADNKLTNAKVEKKFDENGHFAGEKKFFHKPHLETNYHLRYGKQHDWGFCYHGKLHYHWSHYYWCGHNHCKFYWCPYSCSYYWWCADHDCYYPYGYCPAGLSIVFHW